MKLNIETLKRIVRDAYRWQVENGCINKRTWDMVELSRGTSELEDIEDTKSEEDRIDDSCLY